MPTPTEAFRVSMPRSFTQRLRYQLKMPVCSTLATRMNNPATSGSTPHEMSRNTGQRRLPGDQEDDDGYDGAGDKCRQAKLPVERRCAEQCHSRQANSDGDALSAGRQRLRCEVFGKLLIQCKALREA